MRHTMRRGPRRGVALAVGAVLATTVLAGCGSDDGDDNDSNDGSSQRDDGDDGDDNGDDNGFADLDVDEIIAEASAATTGADSLRATGTSYENGQATEIDLALDSAGNCIGSVSLGTAEVELLGVEGEYWFKAPTEFWAEQFGSQPGAEAILPQVADKWIPDTEGQFDEICNLEEFLSDFDDEDFGADAEKGEVTDHEGEEVIELVGVDDDGAEVTALILTSEPHYLVSFENSDKGLFVMSDFNEEVASEAPDPSEVVDLESLGMGG